MAILIGTDGVMKEISPGNGTDFSLKELYELLKCDLIEVVRLQGGFIMILDELGKFRSDVMMINPIATAMAMTNSALQAGDFIVGNAILCKKDELR